MTKRRVVITGVGIVSSLGNGREDYFAGLLAGRIGIDRIKGFDPVGFPCQIGGEISDLEVKQHVPKAHRKATKLMSRDIDLAVVAADWAVRDAGLKTKGTAPQEPPNINPERSGVNVGAGLISCDLLELGLAVEHALENGKFSYEKWGAVGMESLTPLWLLKYLPNMLGCHISIIHDLQGPSNSITCAETSGLLSIGESYRIIARGSADLMVAGGAETKLTPMGLMRQCLLGRVTTTYNDRPRQACRPFDRNADGGVMGEGAGIIILEELEHAQQRGAPIYAEVMGFGASNNFSADFVNPEADCRGVTLAIQNALAEASLAPRQIQLLIAHGAAIRKHDRAEAKNITMAFGDSAQQLSVRATKSRIANCGAASSAIDLATAVLALHEGKIPPNLNCPDPPDEYGLNLGNHEVQQADLQTAMSCCYTYGGQTAAMVIRKV
jgi:3-oxoacyl-[acyl-carrier-protein] synthase II